MEELKKIKCRYCGKTMVPDCIQELWDVEILTQIRCLNCRMVLAEHWQDRKDRKWQSVKEILKELHYIS